MDRVHTSTFFVENCVFAFAPSASFILSQIGPCLTTPVDEPHPFDQICLCSVPSIVRNLHTQHNTCLSLHSDRVLPSELAPLTTSCGQTTPSERFGERGDADQNTFAACILSSVPFSVREVDTTREVEEY
ncbi:hypothetical protein BLNAU_8857 [Blattamonas nauphoetae]|uniref:Uncharacterized protein n=1 Tax=Blattamonas nauphoetae TaxID=2049346 RepID=A0ABQ9XXW4_9EUKA|nr:hypothetical protein BLNAU_8857 [Blattamonas nauphoetae]